MFGQKRNPRILVVTPEITYLPNGMGNMANAMTAKAGGLADVSSSLISVLYEKGVDVHVALPNYRRMFNVNAMGLVADELRMYMSRLSDRRIHLAEDRIFYYQNQVYSNYLDHSIKISLAFQREVISHIIPQVQPDLIHCNDWMTGLIPGFARRINVPCLFTVHNIHTQKITLEHIEDMGIDAANFWRHLYYSRIPANYEETRSDNPVDLLNSGIFASHFINTVSPTFLKEIVAGMHSNIMPEIRYEISCKEKAGCAAGILNSPDPSYNPKTDKALKYNYDSTDFYEKKRKNKLAFQKKAGLIQNADAPLFFWPSRLDPIQKGCSLLTDILYKIISEYWDDNLQVAIVANGQYQRHFHDIVYMHNLKGRVAVCDFNENLSRLGFAASDFMLMPSLFEPCGLPQMMSPIYGGLPIVNDTGGLHDTIKHINVKESTGNGFVFNVYDSKGLNWAIDSAMEFYKLDDDVKLPQIKRVMEDAASQFNHSVTAQKYIDVYEQMLQRPLLKSFNNYDSNTSYPEKVE
ncbi:MAG: glycogen synthase [Sedimentisphaeraceae bacterium JB056]